MLRRILGKLRGFMQAELIAELAALRGEMALQTEAGAAQLASLGVNLAILREELAALRADMTTLRAETVRRDELEPLVKQMQSALLTVAFNRDGADPEA